MANLNCGAEADNIRLLYAVNENAADAITDLIILEGEEYGISSTYENEEGILYYAVSAWNKNYEKYTSNLSLTQGSETEHPLYLFFSRSPRAGKPLTALQLQSFDDEQACAAIEKDTSWHTVTDQTGSCCSTNRGIAGKYALLSFRQDESAAVAEDDIYIADLALAYNDTAGCIQGIGPEEGYRRVVAQNGMLADMNDGSYNEHTSTSEIYLSYTTTSEKEEAITGLILLSGEYREETSFVYHSIIYYPVVAYNGDGTKNLSNISMNRKNTSEQDLYLFYTRDPAAGEPISRIEARIFSETEEYEEQVEQLNYRNFLENTVTNQEDDIQDLNAGAGGNWVFLTYDRSGDGYQITYDTNDGTLVVTGRQLLKVPQSLPVTTKEGYRFVGWFTDENLSQPVVSGDVLTADTTFYAGWDPEGYIGELRIFIASTREEARSSAARCGYELLDSCTNLCPSAASGYYLAAKMSSQTTAIQNVLLAEGSVTQKQTMTKDKLLYTPVHGYDCEENAVVSAPALGSTETPLTLMTTTQGSCGGMTALHTSDFVAGQLPEAQVPVGSEGKQTVNVGGDTEHPLYLYLSREAPAAEAAKESLQLPFGVWILLGSIALLLLAILYWYIVQLIHRKK